MYINKTVFSKNVALYGGAIRIRDADLFIDGCLFEKNSATNISSGDDEISAGRGGAMYVEDSDGSCNIGRRAIALTNSVFMKNK